MSKNKKADFQFDSREFNNQTIKNVWYWGDVKKETEYHSVSKGVFIEFGNEKVYCFYPSDNFNLKLGYGISFKEMKLWDREKKYTKPLTDVSRDWSKWLSLPIIKSNIQWFFTFRSRYYAATHHQSKDFPLDINFTFEETSPVYISVANFSCRRGIDLGANHLIIFFNKTFRRDNYQTSF